MGTSKDLLVGSRADSSPPGVRVEALAAAYCAWMRPATAIVILVLLVVILIAGAFQLRAILTG